MEFQCLNRTCSLSSGKKLEKSCLKCVRLQSKYSRADVVSSETLFSRTFKCNAALTENGAKKVKGRKGGEMGERLFKIILRQARMRGRPIGGDGGDEKGDKLVQCLNCNPRFGNISSRFGDIMFVFAIIGDMLGFKALVHSPLPAQSVRCNDPIALNRSPPLLPQASLAPASPSAPNIPSRGSRAILDQ